MAIYRRRNGDMHAGFSFQLARRVGHPARRTKMLYSRPLPSASGASYRLQHWGDLWTWLIYCRSLGAWLSLASIAGLGFPECFHGDFGFFGTQLVATLAVIITKSRYKQNTLF